MSIVVLGWGSLAYDWHGLSLAEPVRWRLAGPKLPIEFSRKSKTGERKGILTAVIDTACGEVVPTRISESELTNVADVRAELRIREGETRLSWITSIDRGGLRRGICADSVFEAVHQWLLTTGHDAAVWTAIPPDFGGEAFSWALGVRYFRSLDERTQQLARNYIARAPDEVSTPLRRALKKSGLLKGADPRPIDVRTVWTD